MAPASKRRKVGHDSSDESDEASFASADDSHDDQISSKESKARNGVQKYDSEEDESDADEERSSEEDGQDGNTKIKQNRRGEGMRKSLDMNQIALSAGSFKNNMFKLQIDELLNRIRPKRGSRQEAAEQALHSLKKTIEQMQPRGPLTVHDAERQLLKTSKLAIPFPHPRPPKDAKYTLEFVKPTNVNVVGSYAVKTTTRSEKSLEIDMSLTMPSSLFQEKDFLNHRYFYKRAYFLACVAANLKQAHSDEFIYKYEHFRDDPLKPILVVTAHAKAKAPESINDMDVGWRINVLPCISPDVFASAKLLPSKNSVRVMVGDIEQATPFYNSSLRSDMLLGSYLKLLHGAATTCAAFRDAAMLGQVWLRQRGFDSSLVKGGFGAFEWATLMALMLNGDCSNGRPILSPGHSSYQLFKATLQFLAVKDFSKPETKSEKSGTTVQHPTDGTPLLWDEVRLHNLLYKVSPWSYKSLRNEAKVTLTMLGSHIFDGFRAAFIQRVDMSSLRYDCALQIPVKAISETIQPDAQSLLTQCRTVYDVLQRGLGDRVSQMKLQLPSVGTWALGSTKTHVAANETISIGFVVNPDNVNRTVDHGPAPEDKAAATEFRTFWGEKAELRRFRDGSILESLVWSDHAQGQSVLEQIIRYLLARSFGEKIDKSISIHTDNFTPLVGGANAAVAFQPATDAFKRLESDIRGLDSLPLSIRHITPSDAQLRSASITTPLQSYGKQRSIPADVILQFEGSARWPDELAAIQRTKIAFLLNLSQALAEHVENVSSRICLENEDQPILNQASLILIYNSGASFRIRIHHDREQTLLERQLKDKTSALGTKEAAATGLASYKRDYIHRPAHTQSIIRLCSRFPTLNGTIRLLKKWFAAHLLTNHFADELIELFAAQTFLQPWPFSAPSSVQTGFLRTLHWLSKWDWRDEPLIVDLSGVGDLKPDNHRAIQTRFEAWRKLDPNMDRVALFAASQVDLEGNTWTDRRPAKVVVGRAMALAKAACLEAESKYMSLQPETLFSSSLLDYNFVLHLNRDLLGFAPTRTEKTFKNLELASLNDTSLVGLDLMAEFLAELQKIYGSAAVFFSGGHERPVIAGLWSPMTARRGFRVNLAYSTIPLKTASDDETQVEANRDAMLAEMARLGGDLIVKVEVNQH